MEIPLFPLNAVLFPGGRLRLKVFEARYVDMTAGCLRSGKPFGVCLIRRGQEVGAPAEPAEVGTFAHIVTADMRETGIFELEVEGGQRFVVEDTRVQGDRLLLGRVRLKPDEPPEPLTEAYAACLRLLALVAEEYPDARLSPLRDEMPWVGFRLAEVLPLRLPVRQALLEMNDSRMRLSLLLEFMRRQGLA